VTEASSRSAKRTSERTSSAKHSVRQWAGLGITCSRVERDEKPQVGTLHQDMRIPLSSTAVCRQLNRNAVLRLQCPSLAQWSRLHPVRHNSSGKFSSCDGFRWNTKSKYRKSSASNGNNGPLRHRFGITLSTPSFHQISTAECIGNI
jgi:hypothetical protein